MRGPGGTGGNVSIDGGDVDGAEDCIAYFFSKGFALFLLTIKVCNNNLGSTLCEETN